ncbi:Hydrogenase isoenzymes formation protein HypE [Hartmannibacter diazotrophicus]|uniref:Hydrogenase isoenzymes formation protein HypE n=1 Tax=Hartmannibacter diazotrophicus TaxID=1482074 RepID=A0A2C9D127_9HYPH|nr:hydrogenase expression/formation protein HypE [Hartmannibacter diazotrophicus]SON53946.1 Hydrogenase isoenzymes formation protein HypE [Hartmannibacter diazotrophicus]
MNAPMPPVKPAFHKTNATRVTLAHGGGGKAMRDLVEDVFVSAFYNPETGAMEDQARLDPTPELLNGGRLAFTTDSFVVDPLFFPGGDIGKLAVYGTVNDLAVGGAKPKWLSASFIIEEGCEVETLRRVAASMRQAADLSGVAIVTGDTKVVAMGAADKLFVTTAGVGVIPPGTDLGAHRVRPGDVAIVNGFLGHHGAAILAARGDLALETDIASDCAPLNALMEAVAKAAPNLRAARDATRGGLAAALNEIAASAGLRIVLEETSLPLKPDIRGFCEILGFDPLYLANEGTLVLFVPPDEAEAALAAMRRVPEGRDAAIIGSVTEGTAGRVEMKTLFGGSRIVDMLVGEQLPRIC